MWLNNDYKITTEWLFEKFDFYKICMQKTTYTNNKRNNIKKDKQNAINVQNYNMKLKSFALDWFMPIFGTGIQ